MSEKLLEMRNVTKRFPGVLALNNVNIDLNKGEILGIVGENGAGKSTLMKVLSGSYTASQYEGDILIDGQKQIFNTVADAQQAGIEMVYQEINVMMDASVAENIFVGNLPRKHGFIDYKKLYADTQELLDIAKMDISPKMHVRPLNSGQMQTISLLRAYAKKPRIMVLDEPTTALTDSEVDNLMDILNGLRAKGTSCIYISHKLAEIYRICDRVTVIRDGQTISSRDIEEVTENRMIEEMVGRKIEDLYPKTKSAIGDEVLRVENLTVPHPTIPGKNIVEDISFNVRQGEILGLGGLVGAGRSETLGAIFGQYTKGVSKRVFIRGKEVHISKPEEAINHGIGFITEERKKNGIVWMNSIRENISLASLPSLSNRFGFIKEKKEKAECAELFKNLRIKAPSMETKIVNLSGGNQQKCILGKWLLNDPDILFVDEPTKGIDVGTKADFYMLLSDMAARGVTIVMVSSDMPELISMSDRVLVLCEGKITAELTGEAINEKAVMRAAIASELRDKAEA